MNVFIWRFIWKIITYKHITWIHKLGFKFITLSFNILYSSYIFNLTFIIGINFNLIKVHNIRIINTKFSFLLRQDMTFKLSNLGIANGDVSIIRGNIFRNGNLENSFKGSFT
ncbi:hypothetical protein RhiirC2_282182 [Rhizophagus irregularis]|uniref:Uncharacterized protein n=1 Tax=Rhizophagus irregularis TaxID=588596 RepID=A0A2N1NLA7_9GLOM|nr:hypothetical protein RhiirC2_282182 [Rhizophagus irregularis]